MLQKQIEISYTPNCIKAFMVLLTFLLSSSLQLSAQQDSVRKAKWVPVLDKPVMLDSLSIAPFSVVITGEDKTTVIDTFLYDIDYISSTLTWKQKVDLKRVWAEYVVLPIAFKAEYFHKHDSIINKTPAMVINPFEVKPDDRVNGLADFGKLDYNGSFARGLSFGNNQNVVLNSSFNLQLAGKIGGDVEILAAMTDNNIPIQPQGNTQQIQEFDKVFIQLKKDRHKLIVGDFNLFSPKSYFMKYNKKLQGLQLNTGFAIGKQKKTEVFFGGSVAVSKGQYGRNAFFGQEGNQGPYRLIGNNGESFIIILAGTEKVYIDGELMKRGATLDYIIDYNSGEITFMPGRLITKDKRIVFEFEYSVQYYFRSIYNIQNQWKNDKWNVGFNLYSEQDSKNQPVLQELDSAKRQLLYDIGDSVQLAFYPGWDSVEYSSDLILYEMIDTTVNSVLYDSVFLHSTDPAKAAFRVKFSFVGQGRGNYEISSSEVNGRVYQWVAPENNVRQGSYEPVIKLVAPNKKQVMTLNAEYRFSEKSSISTEVAMSNNDINTFSPSGNEDNKALAFNLISKNNFQIGKNKKTTFSLNGSYEFKGKRFESVNIYRNVEFARDWNVDPASAPMAENLLSGNLGFRNKTWGTANYAIQGFIKPGEFNGLRHIALLNLKFLGFRVISNSNLMQSKSGFQDTRFFRPNIDISKSFGFLDRLTVGFYASLEDNKSFVVQTDSLAMNAFSFNEMKVYIKNADSSKTPFRLDVLQRFDYLPVAGEFVLYTKANSIEFTGGIMNNPRNSLQWNINYRNIEKQDTTNLKALPQQTVLGRLTHNVSTRNGLIRATTLYEAGSVQEQKREYTFLLVPEGQGVYIWNDNGDGIQQLDEFVIASETDVIFANYIRVSSPTNEFVPVSITQFNILFDLNPKLIWQKKGNFLRFLSKFNNVLSVRLNKKSFSDGKNIDINPFDLNVADSSLVATTSIFRNSLYFNRFGGTWSVEVNYQDTRNKQILNYGPESSVIKVGQLNIKWIMNKIFSSSLKFSKGNNANFSEAFTSRTYQYDFVGAEPELVYQSGNKFRIKAKYVFADKRNLQELGGETAIIHQLAFEGRYNVISKGAVNIRFSYANIQFDGNDNTTLAYNMLGGLKDGQNFLWNITLERKLANFIQISLSYDGKKSGTNRMIHVGRAQVRAIF
jgi:hypothetical protein